MSLLSSTSSQAAVLWISYCYTTRVPFSSASHPDVHTFQVPLTISSGPSTLYLLRNNKTNTTFFFFFAMAVPTSAIRFHFDCLLPCNKPPQNFVTFKKNTHTRFYYLSWFKNWLELSWMVLLLIWVWSGSVLLLQLDGAEAGTSRMSLFMWLWLCSWDRWNSGLSWNTEVSGPPSLSACGSRSSPLQMAFLHGLVPQSSMETRFLNWWLRPS